MTPLDLAGNLAKSSDHDSVRASEARHGGREYTRRFAVGDGYAPRAVEDRAIAAIARYRAAGRDAR